MPGTVRLRNTNPLGQVDMPLLRRVLEPGEEFDCPAEHAKALLKQTGNYELVEPKKRPAAKATKRAPRKAAADPAKPAESDTKGDA